ncbi:hypothetical protein FB451DRAFT_1394544 [Mycena latifolia]|nr:hypothetical protein FB451DRAFT_1394544 [Mycena latifolia]
MPFAQTYDAFLPSNYSAFLVLANSSAAYVPFETLRAVPLPLDAAHVAAYEFSKKVTPHSAFLHVLRVFYFALALLYTGFPSGTPGVQQIAFEELAGRLYYASLLHDVGWSTAPEVREHPAHAMTFELHGAFMAYEYLHATAPTLDAHQVGDIVESIVLHTSLWPSGTSSATKTLLSLSAFFDVTGYEPPEPGSFDSLFNRQTVQEIEKEYPRGTFANDSYVIFDREFALKPDCLASHYPGGLEGFKKAIQVGPLVPVA